MKKSNILLLLLLFTIKAQAQLTVSGEIRPRSEYRNGFKSLIDSSKTAAFFTEQRSRLKFNYKTEKYIVHIALQDIRIWGQTNQIYKNERLATSFLSEAWGRYYINSKFSLKFGRQMISYDNQRFLGALEWAQQGRRHDALLFMYEDDERKMKIHVGGAFNQDNLTPEPKKIFNNDYTTLSNYKHMVYIWGHKEYENLKISLLAMNDGYQYNLTNTTTATSNRQTIGEVSSYTMGKLTFATEAYLQMGQYKSKKDLNAYMLDVNVTYKTDLTPITIGYQILSGNKNDSKNNVFSPAYGTNHAFNGFMDYFYVGNDHGSVGLQDVYIKTKFKLKENSSLTVHGHQFLSAVDIKEGLKSYAPSLGTEIDLVYNHVLTPEVNYNIGYSQMFATESMQYLKGGDKNQLQNWVWFMITFKPTFFSSK